jgi:Tfp pilus assembly protein PilO
MSKFWQRLSKRERGLVVLTLLIVVVFVGKYAAVTPFLERREWVKSQLESQPQLLQKNLRYLGQKEALLGSLEAARGQIKAQEPRLLTGDTPSVSASDLQETVQALATREGTQVITTRVLNPEPAGSFSKIGIQLEIGGQIQQVANLIRGIETAPKLLVIDEVNVRSLFRPLGFPQPQGVPQVNTQNLRISLTVTGFARVQPAVAAPSSNSGKPAKAADEKPV